MRMIIMIDIKLTVKSMTVHKEMLKHFFCNSLLTNVHHQRPHRHYRHTHHHQQSNEEQQQHKWMRKD